MKAITRNVGEDVNIDAVIRRIFKHPRLDGRFAAPIRRPVVEVTEEADHEVVHVRPIDAHGLQVKSDEAIKRAADGDGVAITSKKAVAWFSFRFRLGRRASSFG